MPSGTAWSSRRRPRPAASTDGPRSFEPARFVMVLARSASPASPPPFLDAPLLGRRARVVRGVLAADLGTPVVLAPIGVEKGATTGATPLLGEQRLQRRDRVDLAATRPAGESRHLRIVQAQYGNRGRPSGLPKLRRTGDVPKRGDTHHRSRSARQRRPKWPLGQVAAWTGRFDPPRSDPSATLS